MKDEIVGILLIIFCVLGFGVNLFVRGILIYLDWQNGEKIDWLVQSLYVFGIPAVIAFAIIESMAVLGFFSSQPAVFDFQQQIK